MPLYDYNCHKCGKTFEVRQKFADALLTVHEGCGGELERLISAPALQFKGTGWYVTDYGKKSNLPSGEKAETKPGDAKGETKESKTGTKTETKTESKPAPAAAPTSSSSDK